MYMYYYSACLDFISVCNEKQRVRKCHRIPNNTLNLIDVTLAFGKKMLYHRRMKGDKSLI